jgi:membrane dipeptidase
METELSSPNARARALLASSVVWDAHGCMPLRADAGFLPQLERYRSSGVTVASLNVGMAEIPWTEHLRVLSFMRQWIAKRPEHYRLVASVEDIERCKQDGRLGITFDIEGMCPVQDDLSLVQTFYELGVRWMLIAYNRNNKAGGGCQDEELGLTSIGRQIIDEMERVGMVLCCSHTSYRAAREALEYAKQPVIFSHSNPRALWDHPRNIPDDLIRLCARSGGVVNLNGIGIFLGDNDNTTETLVRHIDYVAQMIGPEHVGLGLDYVFDPSELTDFIKQRPDIFPPEKGYDRRIALVEPERIPAIAEALLMRGYAESAVQGILGHNNLRVARQVWRS